jgi:hypothetical protein
MPPTRRAPTTPARSSSPLAGSASSVSSSTVATSGNGSVRRATGSTTPTTSQGSVRTTRRLSQARVNACIKAGVPAMYLTRKYLVETQANGPIIVHPIYGQSGGDFRSAQPFATEGPMLNVHQARGKGTAIICRTPGRRLPGQHGRRRQRHPGRRHAVPVFRDARLLVHRQAPDGRAVHNGHRHGRGARLVDALPRRPHVLRLLRRPDVPAGHRRLRPRLLLRPEHLPGPAVLQHDPRWLRLHKNDAGLPRLLLRGPGIHCHERRGTQLRDHDQGRGCCSTLSRRPRTRAAPTRPPKLGRADHRRCSLVLAGVAIQVRPREEHGTNWLVTGSN